MTLTDVLKQEAEHMYVVTEKLFQLVDADKLDWKPSTGSNWMTVGQLIQHCTSACGGAIEGMSFEDLPPDQMLQPAENLPSVESIEQALGLLATDKQTAFHYLEEAGEGNLLSQKLSAPWGGPELTLFQHLYQMIGHLGQHKGQLFYYLKLQGKGVNTADLWGA